MNLKAVFRRVLSPLRTATRGQTQKSQALSVVVKDTLAQQGDEPKAPHMLTTSGTSLKPPANTAGTSVSNRNNVPLLSTDVNLTVDPLAQYKTPGLELRASDVHEAQPKPHMTDRLYSLIKLDQLDASVNRSLTGPRLLLLVATGNKFKKKVLAERSAKEYSFTALVNRAAREYGLNAETDIEIFVVPHRSGVAKQPNQPYGLEAAIFSNCNRANMGVALASNDQEFAAVAKEQYGVQYSSFSDFLKKQKIGGVLCANIENIFEDKDENGQLLDTCFDTGFTMFYNPVPESSESGQDSPSFFGCNFSRKVLVDRRYVDRAKQAGDVEVGKIIAGNVEGAPSDDWHKFLTKDHVSRYTLLREALEGTKLPPLFRLLSNMSRPRRDTSA